MAITSMAENRLEVSREGGETVKRKLLPYTLLLTCLVFTSDWYYQCSGQESRLFYRSFTVSEIPIYRYTPTRYVILRQVGGQTTISMSNIH